MFNGIGDSLAQIWDSIVNGFNSISDWLSNFWDSFIHIFIPSDDYLSSLDSKFNDFYDFLRSKFEFISGFENFFRLISNTEGQPLYFKFYFLGQPYEIDFSWYEPYRLTIRSSFSALFVVFASIKIWKIVSSMFQINISG